MPCAAAESLCEASPGAGIQLGIPGQLLGSGNLNEHLGRLESKKSGAAALSETVTEALAAATKQKRHEDTACGIMGDACADGKPVAAT